MSTETLEPEAKKDEQETVEPTAEAGGEVKPEVEEEIVEEETSEDETLKRLERIEKMMSVEPDDNAERSQMGRRLKRAEGTIEQLLNLQLSKQEPVRDLDENMTVREAEAFWAKKKQEENRATEQYEGDYVDAATNMGRGLDKETHGEILKIMYRDFNFPYSNNPTVDAGINYQKAQHRLMKETLGKKKDKVNPLKAKKADAPLGVSSATRTTTKTEIVPELDEHAKRFVDKLGKTPEQIKKALNEPDNTKRR